MRIAKFVVTAVAVAAAVLTPAVGAISGQLGDHDTTVSADSAGDPDTGADDDTPWG